MSLVAPLRRPVSLLVMPEIVQDGDKIRVIFPGIPGARGTMETLEFRGDEDQLTLLRENIRRSWDAGLQKFRACLDCLEQSDPPRSYPWMREKGTKQS